MIAFAYYLLKMLVCSGILFLYYHLALRNKIFHQWNRFYLLAAIIISILVPCLQFNIWSDPTDSTDIKILQAVYSADEYVAQASAGINELSLDQWITILYSLVSVFVLVIFILALAKIYSIIRSHSIMSIDDIKFVNTEEKSAPFSFLNYVFWNKQIDLQSSSGEHIFQHELVHVREKHSFDKLFMQLVLIVFWCNPFFWLMRRELKMIHEFIADKKSVGQSDAHAFATMILHAAYPQHYSHLTSQFFHSSIKRRLAMLTKNTNPKISYLSRVLALPLMALLILAFTVKEKKNVAYNKPNSFKTSAIIDTVEATSKESQMVEFLAKRIKLINKSNHVNNDRLERTMKDMNEGHKKDSSTPNPLIIINGKEVGKKSTTDLNQLISPEKIESIDVLKGASAIAKYGEKGKDGAIEIITKQGASVDNLMEKVARQNLFEAPPLVIIDGKESDRLKELSPDEIASISVLKGASAINKYGEKGKGGVIEILTKPSKQGKTSKETIKEIRVEGIKISPSESNSLEEKKNNQIQIREGVKIDKPELNEVVVEGYGKKDEVPNIVFEKLEKEPEFPGGTAAWQRFLQRNLKPTVPADNGAPSGSYTVTVQFIVDMQGNISNIKPLTKHGYGMEEEVVRLIKRGPKWVPGVQNGRNVNAYKKQNVTFFISVE
jgi:beta-lactamase regulating signal transducer with metallopeptidase domain